MKHNVNPDYSFNSYERPYSDSGTNVSSGNFGRVAYRHATRKVSRKLKALGATALLAIGAFAGYQVGHGSNGALGGGFGSAKPKAEAAVKPNITTEAIQQISCNANIYFNVGATASAREYYVSGFSVSSTYPFEATFCAKGQGLEANTFITKTAAGKVKDVKVYLPQYFAVNPAMNFNDAGVYCSGLTAGATNKQINQAISNYNNEVKNGQIVSCGLNEHTTGLGLVSDGTAAETIFAAQSAAQNAADLSSYNQAQESSIDNTISKQVVAEDSKRYGISAKRVEVVIPPVESQLSQIKTDWNNNGKKIDGAMRYVKFTDVNNHTYLDETSYWGANITIGVPYLPPNVVSEANSYIAAHTIRP